MAIQRGACTPYQSAKLTCTLLDGIIQRTKEPSLPGRRRLPWPSRILVLIALSSRPYVVPGSASTALMKLSVMAPIEDDSSENPCVAHGCGMRHLKLHLILIRVSVERETYAGVGGLLVVAAAADGDGQASVGALRQHGRRAGVVLPLPVPSS